MSDEWPVFAGDTIDRALVVGLAVTGRAVTDALLRRDIAVIAADDKPSEAARVAAADRSVELVEAPDSTQLEQMLKAADVAIPSPGVPRHHDVYRLADDLGVPVVSELDLAAMWDQRPMIAITGTNGKTTVTTLVTAMLRRGGIEAVAAGNVDIPLVEAIDRTTEPRAEWFVVEASSFRLERVTRFAPRVGAWLNLAPDHLDWHPDMSAYEAAKARIWANNGEDDVMVIPALDETIAAYAAAAPGRVLTFGGDGDVCVVDDHLVCRCDGSVHSIIAIDDLPRRLPHDVANAAAAAACAIAAGVDVDAIALELRAFTGLPHRMALIGTVEGVDYYDDSKATTPEATVAAVKGFGAAVLIAGGKNKGLDLSTLALAAEHLSAVIAIGEAASAVASVFDGLVPVVMADSMSSAVAAAGQIANADAVVLSPACASFDWYANYADRGDDFARIVDGLVAQTSSKEGSS